MIGLSSALAPTVYQTGLQVGIGPAALWLNGAVTNLPFSFVFLQPNTTNYIYLSTSSGLVGVNQSGFSATNIPIATVTTGPSAVQSLIDNRPDFTNIGSGGGSPNFANAEIPTGAINGVNTAFLFSHSPSPGASLMLTLNGQVLLGGLDYTLVGQTATFVNAPVTGDIIAGWYRY